MLRGLAAGFLTGAGFGGLWNFFAIHTAWRTDAPRSPDPSRGLIYPDTEHGVTVYFSAFQTGVPWILLLLVAFLSIPIGVVVAPKRRAGTMRWEFESPVPFWLTFLIGAAAVTCVRAVCGWAWG